MLDLWDLIRACGSFDDPLFAVVSPDGTYSAAPLSRDHVSSIIGGRMGAAASTARSPLPHTIVGH